MFNRDGLNGLFDYTDFTWASYGNTVRTLPTGAFVHDVPDSGWGSLRDALFHVGLAWDGWAYERLGLGPAPEVREDDVATWGELQEHRTRVRSLMRRALDETSDADLQAKDILMWPGTPAAQKVSVADVLSHILLHERGHHGDISTLFQSLGATPPGIDYLVYTFFQSRKQR